MAASKAKKGSPKLAAPRVSEPDLALLTALAELDKKTIASMEELQLRLHAIEVEALELQKVAKNGR